MQTFRYLIILISTPQIEKFSKMVKWKKKKIKNSSLFVLSFLLDVNHLFYWKIKKACSTDCLISATKFQPQLIVLILFSSLSPQLLLWVPFLLSKICVFLLLFPREQQDYLIYFHLNYISSLFLSLLFLPGNTHFLQGREGRFSTSIVLIHFFSIFWRHENQVTHSYSFFLFP